MEKTIRLTLFDIYCIKRGLGIGFIQEGVAYNILLEDEPIETPTGWFE